MMSTNDIADYSVRFKGLESRELEELKGSDGLDSISVGKYFKDKSKYVLVVRLSDATNINKLAATINSKMQFDIDLFISVSSDVDSQIIALPRFVVELISLTKLNVNLSFTFTED